MATTGVSRVIKGRVLGAAFLALLVLFVWLTYAIFSKKFVDFVTVELKTANIGLQLPQGADVKVRGMIVGEVRDREVVGDGAVLTLGLSPDKVDEIPSDVTGLIVPKTLFGEKYVALQVPSDPSSTPIAAGDVIEKASVPIEVEKVLADSTPLLEAVPPEQLAYTLNALSTALDGRGEQIGDNLVRLDSYLKKMNPLVPTLIDDLQGLGEVSDVYASVMPQIGATLKNTSLTGRTVVSKADQITALYGDVTMLSGTTRDFLQANGDNIIQLGRVSVPILEVLARYSPEYPCLLQGITNFIPLGAEAFRGQTLHINLEPLPNQPTGYTPADEPQFNGLGPACLTLPTPPYSQANPGPAPGPEQFQAGGVNGSHNKFRASPRDQVLATLLDPTSGYAGTQAEQQVVDAIVAPLLGVEADDVPDVAALLMGPMARGMKVNVR